MTVAKRKYDWRWRYIINFEEKLITEEQTSRALSNMILKYFTDGMHSNHTHQTLDFCNHTHSLPFQTIISPPHAIFLEIFYTIGLWCAASSKYRMLIVLNLWLCSACDRYAQNTRESFCMWSRYNNFCCAQYMNRLEWCLLCFESALWLNWPNRPKVNQRKNYSIHLERLTWNPGDMKNNEFECTVNGSEKHNFDKHSY